MQKTKKDYLNMLSVREIRLEAKKLSINLYSRKNKRELVELILKDGETVLIDDKSNDEVKAVEERQAFENAKAEEERQALENAKAEEERQALEIAKAEEERQALENAKAEEERKVFESANAQEELKINSDENSYLKRLLSKSFPNKKVSVTNNKDGSQTILIH